MAYSETIAIITHRVARYIAARQELIANFNISTAIIYYKNISVTCGHH